MFDLVTMTHVLEHVHDPCFVLEKIRRSLRTAGVLRIWVPNVASPEAQFFRRFWFGLDVPRHLTHFSPVTPRAVLEHAGFRIERVLPEFQATRLSGSLMLWRTPSAGGERRTNTPGRCTTWFCRSLPSLSRPGTRVRST